MASVMLMELLAYRLGLSIDKSKPFLCGQQGTAVRLRQKLDLGKSNTILSVEHLKGPPLKRRHLITC